MIRTYETVQIVQTDLVNVKGSDDGFHFRVEILRANQEPRRFFVRIWRCESYDIVPSFKYDPEISPEGEAHSQSVLVEDHTLIRYDASWETPSEALEAALAEIEERFESVE